jgi:hypothetical protein
MPQDDQGDSGTAQGLVERARQNAEANAYVTQRDHPSTPTEPKSNPYATTPQDKVTNQRPAPKGEKAMYKKAMDWSSGLKKKAPVYDDGGVVDTDSADGKKSDDAKTDNAKKVQQAESVIGAAGQAMSAPHQYHEGAYGPVYDKGGKVNVNDGKHQVAILKDGERVLTEKQNSEWEKAKNLGGVDGKAPTTLPIGGKTMRDANDVTPDMTPKKVYDKGGVVGEYSGQEKSEFHRAMSHLHGGALHRHFGIPEDQPIPMAKKQEAANSDNPHVAKMGHMAVAMHSWKHGKKK